MKKEKSGKKNSKPAMSIMYILSKVLKHVLQREFQVIFMKSQTVTQILYEHFQSQITCYLHSLFHLAMA
jgi:predicted acyltransferase